MSLDIKVLQEELETQSKNTSLFLEPGIHEDVKLEKVIVKETPVGVNVLEMTFSKDGKRTYYTEWLDEAKADDAKKKVIMSILQVLRAVVPKAILDTMEVSYDLNNFAEKSALVLTGFMTSASLRLKTVYVKDKVTVPLHSKFIWVENMNEKDSKIQMFPRDQVTPLAA